MSSTTMQQPAATNTPKDDHTTAVNTTQATINQPSAPTNGGTVAAPVTDGVTPTIIPTTTQGVTPQISTSTTTPSTTTGTTPATNAQTQPAANTNLNINTKDTTNGVNPYDPNVSPQVNDVQPVTTTKTGQVQSVIPTTTQNFDTTKVPQFLSQGYDQLKDANGKGTFFGQPYTDLQSFTKAWQDYVSKNPKADADPSHQAYLDPNAFNSSSPANLTQQQIQTINQQNAAANPQLPPGASVTTANIQDTPGTDLSLTPALTQPTGQGGYTATQATAGQATAAQVNSVATASSDPTHITASTYGAAVVDPHSAAVQVNPMSTVQGQLSQLLNFDPNGPVPTWATGAVTSAKQFMAARGIESSTMAGQAITQALISAALPIAQSDASTFQQTALSNQQAQVQFALSDQGAVNASSQFNSTSTNQTNQFISSLANNINQFNASQMNSIAQYNASNQQQTGLFNASQETQTSIQNAQLQSTASQFDSDLTNRQQQFNISNGLVIAQSNAAWQRQINTANTAAANQASQINAVNTLGISNQASANLWQQAMDQATWSFTATQNAQNRGAALASAMLDANSRLSIAGIQQNSAIFNSLGSFAGNIFNNALKLAGSGNDGSGSGSGPTGTYIGGDAGTTVGTLPEDTP